MDADRGLVESGHRADLTRRAVAEVAQHEYRALPAVEPVDGGCHTGAALARQRLMLGIGVRLGHRRPSFCGARDAAADEPAVAARACLPAIQASVDENSCEPDFEWPRFAI